MKTKQTINFFKKYLKSEKKLFISAFILSFISSLLSVGYGMFVGIASEYVTNGAYKTAIITLIIYITVATIDTIFFERLGRLKMNILTNNLMEKISFHVFKKVGKLPAIAFEEKSSGELINRINTDSGKISDTLGQLINTLLSLFSSLIVFVFICFNAWPIAIEIVIYMIIMYFVARKYLPKLKEEQKKIAEENDNAVAEISETIRGIREVKALGITDKITTRMKTIINNIYERTRKQTTVEQNYHSLTYVLSTLLETSAFITAIILISLGMTSFGFFIALTYYIYRFNYAIQNVMNITKSYQKMLVAIERISEITDNKLYEDEKYGTLDKIDIKGMITYKNITFKYNNEDKTVFKDLYLEISPNQITAIVGKSGQGKTSLFNLLLRYFDVNKGEILIDDINIKDFTESSFRQNISIIRQDPFIFNKTIKENLQMIDDNLTIEQIKEACQTAEIDEYITNLPNGYNTVIGEGGVNLSGGQKQRLAIARALLKKSKIILFDEATSALDNANQEKIKQAINNLVKDHTIIIVAHRLSTIENANIIHVVDQGQIVASDTHKNLIKKSDIYQALYNKEN